MRTSSVGRILADDSNIDVFASVSAYPPKEVVRLPVSHSGFTLLELLIVLVIIGLMAGVVFPKIGGGFGGLKLKTDVKKMAMMLRYARSMAVSNNRKIHVVFDRKRGGFEIVTKAESNTDNFPWASENEPEEPHFYQSIKFSEAIRIGTENKKDVDWENAVDICFYPAGGSNGGRLIVRDEKAQGYLLVVDDLSGSVYIKEKNGER